MAFASSFEQDAGLMSEINMTPLVDVMLVLLIIFILTVPAITQAIQVDLPKAARSASTPPTQVVSITIDAAGQIYWDKTPVDLARLEQRLRSAAPGNPSVQLRGDRAVRYERVIDVMSASRRAGIQKIGFVTEARG